MTYISGHVILLLVICAAVLATVYLAVVGRPGRATSRRTRTAVIGAR